MRRPLLLLGVLALVLSTCVRVHVRVTPPETIVEEVQDEDEDEDDDRDRRLHWWVIIASAAGAIAGWFARED